MSQYVKLIESILYEGEVTQSRMRDKNNSFFKYLDDIDMQLNTISEMGRGLTKYKNAVINFIESSEHRSDSDVKKGILEIHDKFFDSIDKTMWFRGGLKKSSDAIIHSALFGGKNK